MPTERWDDRTQNCLHDVRIVGNTELIWDGWQQRVGLRDRLVFPKLLDENLRFSSVAAAKDRPCIFVKEPDFVLLFTRALSEIASITVIEQRKNTADD